MTTTIFFSKPEPKVKTVFRLGPNFEFSDFTRKLENDASYKKVRNFKVYVMTTKTVKLYGFS